MNKVYNLHVSENKSLKIIVFSLLTGLFLTIFGLSDNFSVLRWSVFFVSALLTFICLSSRRYYWGSIFVIFAILFNPWSPPSLSKAEWVTADIFLCVILIYWSIDYFFRNYHKGLLFERFIENKFSEPEYICVDATKDLHKKLRRFVESDLNPDFVFKEKITGRSFAVECKYRSFYKIGNLGDEGVWWKKEQGERYLNYSRLKNYPVYVVIGIGGNPKSPKIISYIPIEIIQEKYSSFIPRKVIEEYSSIPIS
jgi:hypothetical protein